MTFIAPRTLAGWTGRVIFVLMALFSLNLLLYPMVHGGVAAPQLTIVFYTIMIGAPLAGGLLWVLAILGREQSRMRVLEDVDPITALSNRYCFTRQTRRVLAQSGALMLLDIDDFRSINDRRGRRVGDLCLMALSQRFRELTRASDVVGRLDGATFAVYLPGATVEQAEDIADRLSQGILVVNEGCSTYVTTSVGVVLANGRTPLDRLLKDADAALERAKLQGRAKVVVNVVQVAA